MRERLIDTHAAAVLLDTTPENVRALTHREQLTVVGRERRRNLYRLRQVVELAARRAKTQ